VGERAREPPEPYLREGFAPIDSREAAFRGAGFLAAAFVGATFSVADFFAGACVAAVPADAVAVVLAVDVVEGGAFFAAVVFFATDFVAEVPAGALRAADFLDADFLLADFLAAAFRAAALLTGAEEPATAPEPATSEDHCEIHSSMTRQVEFRAARPVSMPR
jgi:hypothetical protein